MAYPGYPPPGGPGYGGPPAGGPPGGAVRDRGRGPLELHVYSSYEGRGLGWVELGKTWPLVGLFLFRTFAVIPKVEFSDDLVFGIFDV